MCQGMLTYRLADPKNCTPRSHCCRSCWTSLRRCCATTRPRRITARGRAAPCLLCRRRARARQRRSSRRQRRVSPRCERRASGACCSTSSESCCSRAAVRGVARACIGFAWLWLAVEYLPCTWQCLGGHAGCDGRGMETDTCLAGQLREPGGSGAGAKPCAAFFSCCGRRSLCGGRIRGAASWALGSAEGPVGRSPQFCSANTPQASHRWLYSTVISGTGACRVRPAEELCVSRLN